MPPSPPPTSTTAAAAAVNGAQHVRRGQRNEKHNRYSKNHSTASNNLASPRRPIRTPTSSPLTMSSGLNNFLSPRTRLVTSDLKIKTQTQNDICWKEQTTNGDLKTHTIHTAFLLQVSNSSWKYMTYAHAKHNRET